jgi:hypothetical protein
MKIRIVVTLVGCVFSDFLIAAEPALAIKNVTVYHKVGRFGGWPANHGIWSWRDEILVGFEAGYFKDKTEGHAIDYSRPAQHLLARSLDGGETWAIETPDGLRPQASRWPAFRPKAAARSRSIAPVESISRTRASS